MEKCVIKYMKKCCDHELTDKIYSEMGERGIKIGGPSKVQFGEDLNFLFDNETYVRVERRSWTEPGDVTLIIEQPIKEKSGKNELELPKDLTDILNSLGFEKL